MNLFWKLTRYARAARFWIFVVLALGAYLGLTEKAHAQDYVVDTRCGHNAPDLNNAYSKSFQYEGQAREACEALPKTGWYYAGAVSRKYTWASCAVLTKAFKGQYAGSTTTQTNPGCVMGTGTLQPTYPWGTMNWTTAGCPPGSEWNDVSKKCDVPCSSKPASQAYDGLEGRATFCEAGCKFEQSAIAGTGALPTGASCAGNTDPCPTLFVKLTGDYNGVCAPDGDGDGVSDANDFSPDDPSDGKDGSQPPAPPPDPSTCDGPGQPPCTPPGDESDNVSSGGGTCQQPPTASGDGILANILFQTWSTRCAAEKGNKALDEIGDGIELVGDNTAPAAGGGGTTDMGPTNTILGGIKDKLNAIGDFLGVGGTGDEDDGDPGYTRDDFWTVDDDEETPSIADVDMSGASLADSCPEPPTFTVGGVSKSLDWDGLCDLGDVIRAMVLLMTAAHCAYIFMGNK